ncbi:hypothetical protein FACS1894202_05420 [Clostridia bacterium]|nr:hypothetical protein FACS1894202_05420 [Clostridia bacterium]
MKQSVKVTRLLPGGRAEVELRRQSACGENCAGCKLCKAAVIRVTANDTVGASVGDSVIVESKSVLSLAVVTYILPIALFFAGYAFGGAILGGAAFVLSLLALIPVSRVTKTVFTITAIDKRIQP